MATNTLSLQSSLHKDEKQQSYLELRLVSSPLPPLKSDEVLIRVEATPINPSDIMGFLPGADLNTIRTVKDPKTGLPITRVQTKGTSNIDFTALPKNYSALPGNEGAGTVIATGDSKEAKKLLNKTVAVLTMSNMWTQYRIIKANEALELLPGTSSVEGSSPFINPYTVIGFIETMKEEKFKGIVHTAAASALGQQLVKACKNEKIPLVNIVRRKEQVDLLKKLGAEYVINSSEPNWTQDLENAIVATGAYLAFDATGGGTLQSSILATMERAANRSQSAESTRYGSLQRKKLYVYGMLDPSPTILTRSFGIAWSIGLWIFLGDFVSKLSPEKLQEVRNKIAKEIKTTFSTTYDREISLTEALDGDTIRKFSSVKTGEKYYINPTKGLVSKL